MRALRRRCLGLGLGLAATGWGVEIRAADLPAIGTLRRGGAVLLLRHSQTEPGLGDPPGFTLGRCETQRNLSEGGRAQARTLGRWIAERGLRPASVRSSQWCRCLDTANLAFGSAEPWAALNSFFDDRSRERAQTRELLAALERVPAARFEVWVTHMVNIAALTGQSVGMGEALVVRGGGGQVQNIERLPLPG